MEIDLKTKKEYNIVRYLYKIQEVDNMFLDGILSSYKKGITYSFDNSVETYLKYITKKPFYISPLFNDVKTNEQVSSLYPKFLLVSAPGAAGKSALAQYISYTYNAIYWDLAQIRLGTNSFSGSILKAVGASNYSSFISNLNNGNVLLVIDAMDEAEVISGRKMLGEFIADISNSLSEYNNANVIFLARTETAQFIATFCAENKISLRHYEIGFFEESQSKEFIKKSLSDSPTPADIECVDAYYAAIARNITQQESKSFLGYAPVLQAMAIHISNSPNRLKMINDFSDQTNCTDIIMNILDELLKREQLKVVEAFQKRCSEEHPEFLAWTQVYSSQEQLVRILNYIIFHDSRYCNYELECIPPYLIDDYQDMINTFLPQHPFIRNSLLSTYLETNSIGFAGPAFRDYTLAKIILDKKFSELAHIFFEETQREHFSFSQIFFECYTKLTDKIIDAAHISYLYESYRAKATALERPYLQCSEISSEGIDALNAITLFGMEKIKPQATPKPDECYALNITNNELYFDQLSNITIDMPNTNVRVGCRNKETRISNSSIICNRLLLNANCITIEFYHPENAILIAKDAIEGDSCKIEIVGDGTLQVSSPNIKNYYKLLPYEYDFENPSKLDITKFSHAMRSILIEFRTHKKDTLAKDAERIDNVTVGNSTLKKAILKYLKARRVIYSSAHLYKIDTTEMQKLGISYLALARMNVEQLTAVYSDFISWENNKE